MLDSVYHSQVEACVKEASIGLLNKAGKILHLLWAFCSLMWSARLLLLVPPALPRNPAFSPHPGLAPNKQT